MMTIKEFAHLCGCNAQTLRYYDKIDLLKPVQVDPWSSYRYYAQKQALDFVKIKNLQQADFSISEIKELLTDGHTKPLKGFKSKQGKSFDAIVAFDGDYNTTFVFPERKTSRKFSGRKK